MKTQYLMLTCLIVSISLIIGCSRQKTGDEAQKLVDKQAELVKEGQVEIEDLLVEMSTIKDSMTITQKRLADDRKFIAVEMKSLEKEKAILQINEDLSSLELVKDSLNQELASNITMERRIFNQIERLENLEDSLINTSDVLTGIVEKSETKYEEDISNIDLQLSIIENQQTAAQRSINLNQRKIDIANRKVQLLQDEIKLLQEEKTDQLRKGMSDNEITSIVADIKGIEKQITSSREKVESAQQYITFYRSKLNELDQLKKDYQEEIESYHESKGIVSEFADEEKTGTQQQVADLQETTEKLTLNKTNIQEYKQLLEQNLNAIEQQIAELETMRLPELQNKVTEIELEDTDQSMTQLKYASELDSLYDALTESGEKFEQETDILSYEQQLLTDKAEESQKERSRNTKKAIIIFSTLMLIFLFALYVIGRIRKRKLSI